MSVKLLDDIKGEIPIDLFVHYPQLSKWLKSKLAFELYTTLIAVQRSTSVFEHDESYLYNRFCNVPNGPKDLSIEQRIRSLNCFVQFHNSAVTQRTEMLERIEKDHKYKELMWALKFKCPQDLQSALVVNIDNDSTLKGSSETLSESIKTLEAQKDAEIGIVEDYCNKAIQASQQATVDQVSGVIDELLAERDYWREQATAVQPQILSLKERITTLEGEHSAKDKQLADQDIRIHTIGRLLQSIQHARVISPPHT